MLFVLRQTITTYFQEILSITGGSSFLEAVVNDTQVVDVQCSSGAECSQLMLSPKGLGSSVVTVHDIGVSPSLEASAVVSACPF